MTRATAGRPRPAHGDPLAAEILRLIRELGLRAGDPMPTELELIDRLAVSRNTVREAIRGLRALGIVDIRHGHGTFVGEGSLAVLAPSLVFRTLADGGAGGLLNLVDIRELVEVGTMDVLAGAFSDETLARLEGLCDEMIRTSLDPAVDREFHRTLYAGLANPLVGQLVDLFWDSYHSAESELTLPADAANVAHTAEQHRAIVKALRAGDAARARTAMTEHFADIRARLARAGG
ncbi:MULTISPECIES: FadR/GntR family transcriptional regulator [Amycolatopsis]|uniref:FadR family transcriptional regulator n=1 Tax=Amycolatopsis dendrobii TaxID=2760662 RepID=A0A7W3W6U8_9PSEU|nr:MULTISPECIES: FadR/GntR family transcriptional regulator [Amycolatopsis]MBB1159939.1 FadR family transcriptional regulator [Amycolatopsis dendrobii]UKD56062.1 FadR family transcriptional regulator [Amycolatopsis sp. FU40]